MSDDDDTPHHIQRRGGSANDELRDLYDRINGVLQRFARTEQQLKDTIRRLDEVVERSSDHERKNAEFAQALRAEFARTYVTKDSFDPVKRIAYAIIALLVTGALGFVGTVVTHPPVPAEVIK